jgi:peptidoglycan/xylan/chitin deacetylase (PgdA/CDA1 family)
MGNVLQPGFFDTNAHSWASFGPVRGIQRLLDIADRQGVKASVMVNGVLAERYPETVADIHRRGHEIVAHSWGMDVIPVYLGEDDERQNIARTQAALAAAAGTAALGWISPRGTGSASSPRLLAEAGMLHHGDCNDDDRPYVIDFGGGRRIAAIPLTMDVNDLPFCVRYGRSPHEMLETFDQIFGALRRETAPLMLDITAHTHVWGRPSGAWVYEALIERVKQHGDVWIATRLQLARHVLASA